MDGLIVDYGIFLVATFTAAVVAGLAGFAFGLIAAAIWLHVISAPVSAALIVAFGLIVQGVAVWKLRRALGWSRLWPFLLGAVFGVPLGIAVLGWANPRQLQAGIGAFLVLYSLYGLFRPNLKPISVGPALDGVAGFLNGVLGGVTGLAGIVVVIWCTLRGWSKDEQRTVFQPVAVATFVMIALGLSATGAISGDVIKLFLIGLPALLAGTWLGLKLYGKLDEASFRRIVLVLLGISGLLLAVPFAR